MFNPIPKKVELPLYENPDVEKVFLFYNYFKILTGLYFPF